MRASIRADLFPRRAAARGITRICSRRGDRARIPARPPRMLRGNSYYPKLPGSRNKWTQLSGGFQASRSRSTSSAARRSADEARAHTGTGVQVRYQTRGLSTIQPLGR